MCLPGAPPGPRASDSTGASRRAWRATGMRRRRPRHLGRSDCDQRGASSRAGRCPRLDRCGPVAQIRNASSSGAPAAVHHGAVDLAPPHDRRGPRRRALLGSLACSSDPSRTSGPRVTNCGRRGIVQTARFLTAADGVGFSFSEFRQQAGVDARLWYKHHWEANYVIEGRARSRRSPPGNDGRWSPARCTWSGPRTGT